MRCLLLAPYPQRVDPGEGLLALPARGTIRVPTPADFGLRRCADALQTAMGEAGLVGWTVTEGGSQGSGEPAVYLAIDARQCVREQGYQLEITPRAIEVRGHDMAGAFYGVATLRQLLRQYNSALPCLSIEDYPDFPVRGFLLDVSRGKVPTMETLVSLVDFLAGLRVNQLQLYMEHTFAYPQHPEAWANASPLTPEEVVLLDRHCRSHHVDLVPCQNSFGHMENWLQLPRYRPMAECPDGFTLPWGERHPGPFSLAPTDPASLEFVRGLYKELLPRFGGTLLNVGCDETYDIGKGRSRGECERKGMPRVYLEFLSNIHTLARERGRTMLFWADMVQEHPELLHEVPRDAIALEWGYEADHPFGERCRRLADAGLRFYVCPGTGTLNAIEGRTDAASANLRSAAEHGAEHGATGYLITEWGDHGHWNHLPVAYYGLAYGASVSWARAANPREEFADALSLQAFADPSGSMGRLVRDLGNTYRLYQAKARKPLRYSSFVNRILYDPVDQPPSDALDQDALTRRLFGETREWVDAAMSRLHRARMPDIVSVLVGRELENTARLVRHACALGDARSAGSLSPTAARRLADDLRGILAEHRSLWLARNRIGGLEEKSCCWFRDMIAAYDRMAAG